MNDTERAVARDAMPVPAWLEGKGGQPEGYCHRQMVDAVRYLVAGGIAWRAVHADFPAWDRVSAFFRAGATEAWSPSSTTGLATGPPGRGPRSGADRRDHRLPVREGGPHP
ncbi:transposase [Streptacidiphilus anmyonensis]|uniref:transposase n=1 Tax=Streptacidiphilus anmyonensis TaxID=405782 RepID=UPI001F173626|nr:transposase [Streptacidiphilus anmyonensis]